MYAMSQFSINYTKVPNIKKWEKKKVESKGYEVGSSL